MPLKQLTEHYQQRVDQALEQLIGNTSNVAEELHQAMHYSTFNGGKRIRPLLVYLTGMALNIPPEHQDAPACAVELIHCYSLVHDDMPAMDDDDLRRGKPTCHKQFSEATALLTGDALQTLAFEALTQNSYLEASQIVSMLKVLAQSSGAAGMAGGQAIDLSSTGKSLSLEQLKRMHEHKTGALIRASVQLGALCSQAPDSSDLNALDTYAKNIGLSFQIKDDILDIESDTLTLGKQQGADISLNKATYPALLGLDGAKKMALECHQNALNSLNHFDHNADPLRELSEYIITRNH
ncbi:MAG: (2E,6E)-farnesyl diphosphate synthase [gamma proteobacterium symbiont of Bathyaustriella thionipta]|nr:(2E,6E)-farnesyl diphosphate synthase [gamma proteobacterium symbiont of Bathyaustriella thionipta]MCU7948639.1 (2E,6E)-farnesyl diphosphate synthase [gamma proteobacterium symbiont of Bathyaustriella thionipta]MCU7953045.1 (2E,6E)-farnesyl diphosphate synthase [gamma proteobacterium symbiont of Bathyaustriella thionipta]MCU7955355.1 (2E,6E)-farnesyl diphosphate synthase [gamma proteobacterium symbiont of Bathyaustriella thionipta]MCU7967519.1 (2E,6E)-farnesyl diphosphate synthase [gamma pro